MNWKTWLYSVIAAGIGGAASAALSAMAMPSTFNLSHAGLINLGKIALVGALVPVLTYLKQSPLPAASITTSSTTTATTTITPKE